jgi:hypothetical protein
MVVGLIGWFTGIYPSPNLFSKLKACRYRGASLSVWSERSAPQIARLSTVNQLRFVAAAEEMSPVPMPPVKSLRVRAQQPFHPCGQIRLRRLKEQMKMIAHQAIGTHLPSGLLTSLT